jgi:hypothetical protein
MITIKEYLIQKNISFKEQRSELITKCLFSNCDQDSLPNEMHLYFSIETGQYHCKKCDAKGNLNTLRVFLGDGKPVYGEQQRNVRTVTHNLVEKHHTALTPEIIEYLNKRGINNEIITSHKIGYASYNGKMWITIPIKDMDGNYTFFKLREDPKSGKSKMTWPSDIKAQIYQWDSLINASDRLLITEGEMDTLLMKSNGIDCITNTHGATTAKAEWGQYFNPEIEYFICYDNDDAGKKGSEKMASLLYSNGCKKLNIISLPEEVGEKGDLGDYVTRLNLPIEDLFTKYSKSYPEKVDISEFKEITIEEVCKILDATIKKDDDNKAVTFLSMLTTYTDESQMNIFFNAPSSTGKSHIPLSVVDLFPKEDTIILAHCSPTAFFHEQGKHDKEKNQITVNLSKKILIFTDMPDTGLISKLRSILSHDAKESHLKITDKNQKGGNSTKTVVIVGYPSVYFCSAGLKIDEQESTRFLMLSPSIDHDKLLQGIQQSISKESDRQKFNDSINGNEIRYNLKRRIIAIKQEDIFDVKIDNPEMVEQLFLEDGKSIKPRQQRDVKKIVSLIKGFALLNIWFRKREGNFIWSTKEDIIQAFKLWNNISYGQDYGLAPYVYEIYSNIIIPLWKEPTDSWNGLGDGTDKKQGVTRKEILNRHFKIYGRSLSSISLRQHILPQLEQVGLIIQERSTSDSREMIVIPLETDIDTENELVEPEIQCVEVEGKSEDLTKQEPLF